MNEYCNFFLTPRSIDPILDLESIEEASFRVCTLQFALLARSLWFASADRTIRSRHVHTVCCISAFHFLCSRPFGLSLSPLLPLVLFAQLVVRIARANRAAAEGIH